MNYKIIQDITLLEEYIEWLPNLERGEAFLLSLFSRKKYQDEGTGLISDKGQLSRKICTSKDRIIQKIQQMETEIGTYYHDNIPIPQKTLALYITPNPRNLLRAGKNTCKELMELIFKGDTNFNPVSIATSNVQTAKSRSEYMIFDIDDKTIDVDFLKANISASTGGEYKILKTFGGYHIYIKLNTIEKSKQKSWYNEMLKIPNIDKINIDLSPVPGCCQSIHIPKFI